MQICLAVGSASPNCLEDPPFLAIPFFSLTCACFSCVVTTAVDSAVEVRDIPKSCFTVFLQSTHFTPKLCLCHSCKIKIIKMWTSDLTFCHISSVWRFTFSLSINYIFLICHAGSSLCLVFSSRFPTSSSVCAVFVLFIALVAHIQSPFDNFSLSTVL